MLDCATPGTGRALVRRAIDGQSSALRTYFWRANPLAAPILAAAGGVAHPDEVVGVPGLPDPWPDPLRSADDLGVADWYGRRLPCERSQLERARRYDPGTSSGWP